MPNLKLCNLKSAFYGKLVIWDQAFQCRGTFWTYIEKKQNSKCGNSKLSIFTVLWIWISVFCKDLSSKKWLERKFFSSNTTACTAINNENFYVDNDYGNLCYKYFHARKNILSFLFGFEFWSKNVTRYNFPFLSPPLIPSDLIQEQDREKKSRSGKKIQIGKRNQSSNLKNEVIRKLKVIYWGSLFRKKKIYKSSLLPLPTLEKPWFI